MIARARSRMRCEGSCARRSPLWRRPSPLHRPQESCDAARRDRAARLEHAGAAAHRRRHARDCQHARTGGGARPRECERVRRRFGAGRARGARDSGAAARRGGRSAKATRRPADDGGLYERARLRGWLQRAADCGRERANRGGRGLGDRRQPRGCSRRRAASCRDLDPRDGHPSRERPGGRASTPGSALSRHCSRQNRARHGRLLPIPAHWVGRYRDTPTLSARDAGPARADPPGTPSRPVRGGAVGKDDRRIHPLAAYGSGHRVARRREWRAFRGDGGRSRQRRQTTAGAQARRLACEAGRSDDRAARPGHGRAGGLQRSTRCIMSSLARLLEHGQSCWMDDLTREMIAKGGLTRRVVDEGVSGVTSNPSVFAKAMQLGDGYEGDIALAAIHGEKPQEIYEDLITADVRSACDVLRSVYDRTHGADGFASLEVSPHLAYDSEASMEEARRLWKRVDRPNLFIKIPGTSAAVPAIEELLFEGININITLLFSVAHYDAVAQAYIRALERRAAAGRSLEGVASVASFFLSRIDVLVDELLEQRIVPGKSRIDPDPRALLGKAAIANAKLAYRQLQRLLASARWQVLAEKGASVQRLLWASTSTKNP